MYWDINVFVSIPYKIRPLINRFNGTGLYLIQLSSICLDPSILIPLLLSFSPCTLDVDTLRLPRSVCGLSAKKKYHFASI